MVPGCAEYRDTGEPYRIFINESTIKSMDATFQGRPVYVQHVDTVNMDKLQAEADGYVVRSFYNQADGKHWAEFIVVSDKGHEAIRNGWRLSNAYIPKDFAGGGLWNGIDYAKEVTRGEYEHLAIVPNPRYDESVIFTPEQFKEYNEKKSLELKRLANSKSKGEDTVFKFFKKEKVENSSDLSAYSVVLESSKKEVTVAEAIQLADKFMNMNGYANGDHMVKVGSDEMSVNDLASKYCEMKNAEDEVKKKNAEDEEKKKKENEVKEEDKKENEDDQVENKDDEEKKENGEDDEEKKKENEEDKEVKKNAFDALRNAEKTAKRETVVVHLDKSARGKARYGSN